MLKANWQSKWSAPPNYAALEQIIGLILIWGAEVEVRLPLEMVVDENHVAVATTKALGPSTWEHKVYPSSDRGNRFPKKEDRLRFQGPGRIEGSFLKIPVRLGVVMKTLRSQYTKVDGTFKLRPLLMFCWGLVQLVTVRKSRKVWHIQIFSSQVQIIVLLW